MIENDMEISVSSYEEKSSFYNDTINYFPSNVENAFNCLLNMNELEKKPNFGKLKYVESKDTSNKRYDIEEYKDKIDSSFYTDKATVTLAYTIKALQDNFGEFENSDIDDKYWKYFGYDEIHDLSNDSEGEFANFSGDESLLNSKELVGPFMKLYAYYNEFQLLSDNEKGKFVNKPYPTIIAKGNIIKKTEVINGVEMDFYFVFGDRLRQFHDLMLLHEHNMQFLEDRIPGNVLDAIVKRYGENDIITISQGYVDQMRQYEDNDWWAGKAYRYDGRMIIKDSWFTEAICHEMGHLFDWVGNTVFDGYLQYDYFSIFGREVGMWQQLAEKYADDIYTIGVNNALKAGYSPDKTREKDWEFYAEAFRMYFYSPETKAALPSAVRAAIEKEIFTYCK